MSQRTIKLSKIPGKVPRPSMIDLNEFVWNVKDGVLFGKGLDENDKEVIVQIGGGAVSQKSHTRLHQVDSIEDHSLAREQDFGKFFRMNPYTGRPELITNTRVIRVEELPEQGENNTIYVYNSGLWHFNEEWTLIIFKYTHPSGFFNQPSEPLGGFEVIAQVGVTDEGHVSGHIRRTLPHIKYGKIILPAFPATAPEQYVLTGDKQWTKATWVLKKYGEATGEDVFFGDDVVFREGSNITITRTGRQIVIASTVEIPDPELYDHYLGDHLDISISSPQTGQLIRFDGSNWTNWTHDFLTASQAYVHPSKAWVNKTTLSGATVISNLTIDSLGHPTNWSTRNLTASNIGAEPTLTKGNLTASGAISISATRQVIGGVAAITHLDTAGYKHIPSSGSTNNLLIYGGSSGTAAWSLMTDTLHGNRGGGSLHAVATSLSPGFMPVLANNEDYFLNGLGQWAEPPSYIYGWNTRAYGGTNSSVDNGNAVVFRGYGGITISHIKDGTTINFSIDGSGISGGVTSVFTRTGDITAQAGDYSAFYEPVLTKGTLGATAPIAVTSGRSVIGGAATITHSTAAGYKHIPSGGASNNFLVYGGSSGTASWSAMNDTLHGNRGGGSLHALATTSLAGFMPVLPNSAVQFLNGLGQWATPPGGDITMASQRMIGRLSAGSGSHEELTAAQVRGFLNIVDGADKYGGFNFGIITGGGSIKDLVLSGADVWLEQGENITLSAVSYNRYKIDAAGGGVTPASDILEWSDNRYKPYYGRTEGKFYVHDGSNPAKYPTSHFYRLLYDGDFSATMLHATDLVYSPHIRLPGIDAASFSIYSDNDWVYFVNPGLSDQGNMTASNGLLIQMPLGRRVELNCPIRPTAYQSADGTQGQTSGEVEFYDKDNNLVKLTIKNGIVTYLL
jgi:hypothetical protein